MGVVPKQSKDEFHEFSSCVFNTVGEHCSEMFNSYTNFQFSSISARLSSVRTSPDGSDDDDSNVEKWRLDVPLTKSSGYHSGGMRILSLGIL